MNIYKGFQYREGTLDLYVLKNIHRDYRGLRLGSTDVVLDIGGHIGAFVGVTAPRVARVVTVEPQKDNFALLMRNTTRWSNVTRIAAAAVPGHGRGRAKLYHFEPGTRWSHNTGSHSLYPTPQRKHSEDVDTVGFDELLADWRPTVLKLDCEGAEYDLLERPLPACVKQLAMELHISRREFREERRPALLASLEAQGFQTLRLTKAKSVPIGQQGVWVR
jgi:FkbM family methyltransferase